MAVDIERVVAAAVDSFLHGDEDEGRAANRGRRRGGRLRGMGTLAVGVGLGLAAQAAIRRARDIDLETAASAVEKRLKG
jgi:hypothetical protein